MSSQPVDPMLVAAWLVFAHLVADFVLQNDWIAINKATGGRLGWSALGVHGFHVALCLVPVVFAFGMRGLAYLLLVSLSHMAVDRWKVQATRLADARAQERARARMTRGDTLPGSGLGAAWSPWPGMLFLADQALHVTIALVGWLVMLEGLALGRGFADFVQAVTRAWDQQTFHAAILTTVVLVALFIVNTRGAFYFALALVSPRELRDLPGDDSPATAIATAPASRGAGSPAPAPGAVAAAPASAPASPANASAVPRGASARIAATAAGMERLLIVAFVLVGLAAGAALVVALDVAARWRQLEDRGFAEYYLVATLGSVSVALGSGLVAVAALASLG